MHTECRFLYVRKNKGSRISQIFIIDSRVFKVSKECSLITHTSQRPPGYCTEQFVKSFLRFSGEAVWLLEIVKLKIKWKKETQPSWNTQKKLYLICLIFRLSILVVHLVASCKSCKTRSTGYTVNASHTFAKNSLLMTRRYPKWSSDRLRY